MGKTEDKPRLAVLDGGAPRPGDEVLVDGRPATVVRASRRTHVFRGEASVRFADGTTELVALADIEEGYSGNAARSRGRRRPGS